MTKKTNALDRAKPIEEWDDEELQQGRLRNKAGGFNGRPPAIPPHIFRQIRAELNRRKLNRAADVIRDTLEKGVRILGEILNDPDARHADKLKATELLMDRAWGKPVNPIIIGRTADVEKSEWELAIDDFVADETIRRAREVNSRDPEELRRKLVEGTSRPATGYDYREEHDDRLDDEDDEQLVRQFLDEELAQEYIDGHSEATG